MGDYWGGGLRMSNCLGKGAVDGIAKRKGIGAKKGPLKNNESLGKAAGKLNKKRKQNSQ